MVSSKYIQMLFAGTVLIRLNDDDRVTVHSSYNQANLLQSTEQTPVRHVFFSFSIMLMLSPSLVYVVKWDPFVIYGSRNVLFDAYISSTS